MSPSLFSLASASAVLMPSDSAMIFTAVLATSCSAIHPSFHCCKPSLHLVALHHNQGKSGEQVPEIVTVTP